MIGYFVAGIGVFQIQSWWRTTAVAASVVSLIVSVLYIQGAPFNAAVADVVILGALLCCICLAWRLWAARLTMGQVIL